MSKAQIAQLTTLRDQLDGHLRSSAQMFSIWLVFLQLAGFFILLTCLKMVFDDASRMTDLYKCTILPPVCKQYPPIVIVLQQFLFNVSAISSIAHIIFLTKDKIDTVFSTHSPFLNPIFLSSILSFALLCFTASPPAHAFYSLDPPYPIIWYIVACVCVGFMRYSVGTLQKSRNDTVTLLIQLMDKNDKSGESKKKK